MQSKMLIAALVVLSVACSALIAWICSLTGQSLLWAAAPLVLFATVLLTLLIASRIGARFSADKLERSLLDQAKAQVRAARPDQKQQVVQLQRDFERAIQDLKASRLGRAGRDALYLLPWYAIIGPSGAGKTTALRNSGLRFPSMRSQDNLKVRGVGGTRNCDFWLTNDAVLLDTAGRWSTQDDDHHEWLGFLQLLRKHRARKPLNGLIAAISIGDVVNASPDEIDALAERMRSRLDEVSSELRVSIPVYVLFTKCDLLEGFVDIFAGLRATEREQILGFTVPLGRAADAHETAFEDYFDELTHNLRGAALARMGETRGSRERARVYAFPDQFSAMRQQLQRFVTRLFENSVYRETAPLRGVYFSSGTQEGRPFNLLFEPLSHGNADVVDQKGYFLRELFMQVIFADSTVASASQTELRRQRNLRLGLSAALGCVSVALGVAPSGVFLRSRQQIALTAALVDAAESGGDPAKNKRAAQQPALSDPVRALFSDIGTYERPAPSWLASLGMYSGARLREPLHRYAARLVRRELVEPVIANEAQALTEFGLRYESQPHVLPTAAEHTAFYAALKLQLLLSSATLDKAYAGWVQERLLACWQEVDVQPASLRRALANDYVTRAQVQPELAFIRDSDSVRRARAALNRASAAQQTLDAIVTQVASLGYDLDLYKLTGYTTAITGTRRVRGAFTRAGYENAVRPLFDNGARDHVDELWVLGSSASAAVSGEATDRADRARLQELETLYFRAYVQEWRSFIEGIRTQAPRANSADALALLTDLTSGEPTPLARLFQEVADNVRLPALAIDAATEASKPKLDAKAAADVLTHIWNRDKPAAALRGHRERVAERFGPAEVAAAFEPFVSFGAPAYAGPDKPVSHAPVPYDTYREQLSYLRDALQLRVDEPGGQLLDRPLQTALVRVRGLIESRSPTFRPTFEALLWPPIRGLHEGAGREAAAWLGQRWCADVVAPYEQTLLGRYPFSANGRDARMDDIDAYYKPGEGLLWKFTAAALDDQVQLTGEHYAYTSKFERGAGLYQSELLEFLDRSRAISRALYPVAGTAAHVDFSVRLHAASSKVDTVTFSVGGKQISYDNGPLTWQTLSWPGPEPARGAAFSIRGRAIRAGRELEGVWGLFRLLEAGALVRSSDDTVNITWRLPTDDAEVWIELRPNSTPSPFFDRDDHAREPRALRLLRGPHVPAPHRIAVSQQGCRP